MAWMLSFVIGVASLLFVNALNPIFSGSILMPALQIVSAGIALLFVFTSLIKHSFGKLLQCLLALILGIGYGQWQALKQLNQQLDNAYDRTDFVVEGKIRGVVNVERYRSPYRVNRPQNNNSDFRSQFLFEVSNIHPTDHCDKYSSLELCNYKPRFIHLTLYQQAQLRTGERWQFTVRLRSPHGFANPGSFDVHRYMLSKRIDARGYIRQHQNSKHLSKAQSAMFEAIRINLINKVTPLFERLSYGGLLQAMLLGQKNKVDRNVREILNDTGTAHLMAISGLHIGIAAGLGFFIGKLATYCVPTLLLVVPRLYISAVFSISLAGFYALIAGFSLSTQRALWMLSIALLSKCWLRNTSPFNHLLIALCILLAIDPLSVLSNGLWLSFAAVTILIIAMQSVNKIQFIDKQPRFYILNYQCIRLFLHGFSNMLVVSIKAQWAIFIAMPLILLIVGINVSLLSPLANLLVVPLFSLLIVPLGLAALFFSYISLACSAWLLSVADAIVVAVMLVLEWLLRTASGFSVYQHSLSAMDILCAVIVIVILLTRAKIPTYYAALILWFLIFDPLNFKQNSRPTILNEGDFAISQIDVGQGTSVLISSANHHWLYDTGRAFSAQSDAGALVIAPLLKHYAVKRLHTLIVSHADNDHAGGAKSIEQSFEISNYLAGGQALNLAQATKINCQRGQQWQLDGIEFKVLHPATNTNTNISENDSSCVIQITSLNNPQKNAQILLTGDVSAAIERQLVEHYAGELASELLIVPHHGSISSSTGQFIHYVNPRFALVSAGFNNHYGHPHPRVQQRYKEKFIPLLRSDQLGAIQFLYINGQWQGPYCERFKNQHFWQNWDNTGVCIGPSLGTHWKAKPVFKG